MSKIIEVVLDIETTGLNISDGHKIIEVGCIELINRKKSGKTFHKYINPQRKVDSEAIKIHGIKDEFLRDKDTFGQVASELRDFIGDRFVVAHNGLNFDIKFLNYEFAMSGVALIDESKVIDTLILARQMYPGSPASLDALCKRFGISLSDRKVHGALLDALLLTNVYRYIKAPTQSQIFLANRDEKTYHHKVAINKFDHKRSFYLSDYEVFMHEEMVKNLSHSLWTERNNEDLVKLNENKS
jgi:DNA polymerase-3 subunit epsilon